MNNAVYITLQEQRPVQHPPRPDSNLPLNLRSVSFLLRSVTSFLVTAGTKDHYVRNVVSKRVGSLLALQHITQKKEDCTDNFVMYRMFSL